MVFQAGPPPAIGSRFGTAFASGIEQALPRFLAGVCDPDFFFAIASEFDNIVPRSPRGHGGWAAWELDVKRPGSEFDAEDPLIAALRLQRYLP
jgi:hypothetical protein